MKKLLLSVVVCLFAASAFAQESKAIAQDVYEIGLLHYNSQKYDKAVQNFNEAAASGNVKAIFSLACCYRDGTGVPQDNAMALDNFTRAANAGNADAQVELGNAYAWKQLGIKKKNYDEAVRWYKLAAEQNNAEGLGQLARCYEKGRGVKKDKAMAADLYQRAKAAGFVSEYMDAFMAKYNK